MKLNRMILPSKIEIQVVDKAGRSNPLGNILFGLKIFLGDGSWLNYSPFKTNLLGQIVLTKQQIIDNTDLNQEMDLGSDTTPTKFELYVWDGDQTDDMIRITKQLLELYKGEEFIQADLLQHGIKEENIPDAIKR